MFVCLKTMHNVWRWQQNFEKRNNHVTKTKQLLHAVIWGPWVLCTFGGKWHPRLCLVLFSPLGVQNAMDPVIACNVDHCKSWYYISAIILFLLTFDWKMLMVQSSRKSSLLKSSQVTSYFCSSQVKSKVIFAQVKSSHNSVSHIITWIKLTPMMLWQT